MRLHLIMATVERLRRDPAFRTSVARDPHVALAAAGFTRDERLALGAVSQHAGAASLPGSSLQW